LGVYGKEIQNPGNEQSKRLRGKLQQERMICDKRRSLARAVWNSYQAAEVIKTTAADRTPARALINPNILK
jgi:murein endopeptidase